MNELSERIYELRTKTLSKIGFDTNNLDFTQRYDALIEQALLAERRLAMEACAEIAKEYLLSVTVNGTSLKWTSVPHSVSEKLRAAAEKEAGK